MDLRMQISGTRYDGRIAMGHGHNHAKRESGDDRGRNRRRLSWSLGLVCAYMVAEFAGGFVTGSLALMADAGHMLSDAGSLALALFALWLAEQPSPSRHTWGYFRTEILAALANGAALVAVSIFIFVEAYHRLATMPSVRGELMMGIAIGGLAVNLIGLRILHGGKDESLNLKTVWLHVLADTLGSIQAIVAGLLIWLLGWNWADPVASLLIGLLVIYSSWNVLKESVAVLMESSPGEIDVDEVYCAMRAVNGAVDVHDLHIWTITSGLIALSAHVRCDSGFDRDELLSRMKQHLESSFGIGHITLQIESSAYQESCPEV
ncbi:MAG: cation diffusion facilitator family transporter [Acidobacteriota bacterium]|jgi:cobalt-zinc-cadmium efflux system protein